ncbi:MAG: glycosyltransferase [Acidobacteriota bacterium]
MPTLELQMIVKDGVAAGLARCLSSVAPVADRILIGDTGSTDATPAIARQFGAELLSVPWDDDFARARNRVLAHRRCDWILVLDADEMLDRDAAHQIRPLLDQPGLFAFESWRWNYMRDSHTRLGSQSPRVNPLVLEESQPFPAYVPSLTTRLFRSHPGIRYEGYVHETVTNRLAALGLRSGRAGFIVHHFGHAEDRESDRARKNDLYQSLIEKKLASAGQDPQALFELGLSELEHRRRPAAALAHFDRACALDPGCAAAWLFAGICLVRTGNAPEALRRLARAADLGLRNAIFWQTLGDVYFHSARYTDARAAYEAATRQGEAAPLALAKLGASEVHLGLKDQGLHRLQSAIAGDPGFAELYDILAAAALLAGDRRLAAETVSNRLAMGNTTEFHTRLAALLDAPPAVAATSAAG